MLSIYEMFIYAVSGWGEKTPRSTFDVLGDKKWPVMKDSNILTRDEGIPTFNSANSRAEK